MTNVIRRMLRIACLIMVMGPVAGMAAEEWMSEAPMSADQLEQFSGRQGIPVQVQLNDNQQSAVVTGNTLSGPSMTGNNMISDHAFGNMSGIATVIQNTGNQVVIQDSTQVNILINR
ncbi:hypothetical protein GCM10011533_01520 [Streptosporangium jomthongense]|uniref:Uncharacterized protein n=1 Tax=Marinobacter aromaticivorans TaxID=1494078 RepID=A0ABW2IPY7_9GAMM|nr:hypothetical protein [Marinobacter aromaticivorans]GGE52768.1 hypothetical protein GCM10011533_01520 [Streptosporangium jomthongense]